MGFEHVGELLFIYFLSKRDLYISNILGGKRLVETINNA